MTAKIEYTEWVEAKDTNKDLELTKGKEYGIIGYGEEELDTVFIIDNDGKIGEFSLEYFKKKKNNIENIVTCHNIVEKTKEIIDFINNNNIECKN